MSRTARPPAVGARVFYHEQRTGLLRPALVLGVSAADERELELVYLTPPTPVISGYRACAHYARSMRAREGEPARPGEWQAELGR